MQIFNSVIFFPLSTSLYQKSTVAAAPFCSNFLPPLTNLSTRIFSADRTALGTKKSAPFFF